MNGKQHKKVLYDETKISTGNIVSYNYLNGKLFMLLTIGFSKYFTLCLCAFGTFPSNTISCHCALPMAIPHIFPIKLFIGYRFIAVHLMNEGQNIFLTKFSIRLIHIYVCMANGQMCHYW